MPKDATGDSRAAARGGLAIAGAKIYFMIVGLLQQILLTRVLGLSAYGALGRIQGVASIIYNPVISTSVQGVSRPISGAKVGDQASTQRRVLAIQTALVIPLALTMFLIAPWLAELMRAPHLESGLHIVSAVLLFYGFYTPLVGALNGYQRFGKQAALDVLAATLRTIGLLAGAWYFTRTGYGVEGALIGFTVSAGLMALVALPIAGIGKAGATGPSVKEHLLFIAPLFGGQFALNLLFQSDFQLLGRFAADAATAANLDAQAADTLAGAYRNAQLFCFLPYQLLLSVTFVLFPLLSSAYRDSDHEAVGRYVATGVRLAFVITGMLVSVTASIPNGLLSLVFGADSAALGTDAMRIMALGLGAFAIFGILTTVLTSLKRERMSALLTVAALALVVVLCVVFVRGQPFGPELLVRTAAGTAVALIGAMLLAMLQVRKVAGRVVAPMTVVRVLVALGAAIGVSMLLPAPGKLMTLVYSVGLVILYLGVLVVTREITKADLTTILNTFGRRTKPKSV